ncbi:site-specific integrase [Spartinivicinus poritis]|uniref:Site-specific integrase n=1 Tax=Spartinivicinus poritis TaxID=2994640 RepID=A0ABT5U960_9GAMM|nr:site-specific integrase [Spartinivicinus sp. A2-2]MDE1462087.1 site-specific integrase [Spartinivicinus sp. A2-2]
MKNIALRGRVYHFRKVIPTDLRSVFQKTEYTFSLQTRSKRLARSRAASLLGIIDTSIYEMRGYTSDNQRIAVYKALDAALAEFVTTGIVQLHKPIAIPEAVSETKVQETAQPSIMLAAAYMLFVKEKERTEWSGKSKACYMSSFRILIDIMKDRPVNIIGKQDATNFLQCLFEYPNGRYVGKDASTDWRKIREEGAPPLAALTVKLHFSRIKTFFGWLETQGYINTNPLDKLTPKGKKTRPVKRDSFSPDELHTIFANGVIQERESKRSWRFWMTVLLLYTGARREEIAQLDTEDVKCKEKIYYLDIHNRGDHHLKNEYSERLIPLHTDIISLGFLQYIESREGQVKLFDVNSTDGIFGRPLTAWFTGLKRKLGFADNKVLHSFRHTFRDLAVESRVPNEHIKALLGHSQGDMTHGVYGSGFSLKLLNESMQLIDFSCVRDILIQS